MYDAKAALPAAAPAPMPAITLPPCPHIATRMSAGALKCMDCGQVFDAPLYCPPGSMLPTFEQMRREGAL